LEHDLVNTPQLNRLVAAILVCLVAVDVIIVSGDLLREGGVGLLTLGRAIAMVGLCALVWSGIVWGRWLLLGFIAWRALLIAEVAVSSFGPGEVLRPGALLVLLLYVGAAVALVSPLARRSKRGET
jgi:hypothetical protein